MRDVDRLSGCDQKLTLTLPARRALPVTVDETLTQRFEYLQRGRDVSTLQGKKPQENPRMNKPGS